MCLFKRVTIASHPVDTGENDPACRKLERLIGDDRIDGETPGEFLFSSGNRHYSETRQGNQNDGVKDRVANEYR